MFFYILRRTFAALVLLLVVAAVTFGIFFLLPRLAGETSDQLAAQYIGKNPSPEALAAADKFKKQYIDKGLLGVKAGKGFYTYPNPAYERRGFLTGEA